MEATSGSGRGRFFAVDRRTWAQVCGLGINPTVAYLVLACFSARDNRTTDASVNAIERYTGISRGRAKAAIKALIEARVVRCLREGTCPQYDLLPAAEVPNALVLLDEPRGRQNEPDEALAGRVAEWKDNVTAAQKPDLIWLPNSLVTGASDEVPPVERVRQMQDVMTLRLLVDLYHAQDLREDGGISRKVTRQEYDRIKVGQYGEFDVWGFRLKTTWASNCSVSTCHWRKTLTKEERKKGHNSGVDFFRRFGQLTAIGLVEWVPTLFESDSDEAEILLPCGMNQSQTLEDRLGSAVHAASRDLLTDAQRRWAEEEGLWLVPVRQHIANVQLIGVARLRYRPRTSKTAAWFAELNERSEKILRRLAGDAAAEAQSA